jgi:hypothetical protein
MRTKTPFMLTPNPILTGYSMHDATRTEPPFQIVGLLNDGRFNTIQYITDGEIATHASNNLAETAIANNQFDVAITSEK